MPTNANVTLSMVPPQAHGPGSTDEDIGKRARKDGNMRELDRTPSSEWVDVDEDKPRRRRRTKRVSTEKQSRPQDRRPFTNDIGRFLPRLSQILETNEQKGSPRTHPVEPRTYTRNEGSPAQRRPGTRQPASQLQFNASLLSLISGITTSTDRSSGSNSTVTQRSYRRRHDSVGRGPHRGYRRPASEASSAMSSPTRSQISYEYAHNQDDESVVSSTPSSHQQSEISSSDGPGTPSSRSTYPSPAFTHNSNAEHSQSKRSASASPELHSTASVITGSEFSGRSESTYGPPSLIDGQYFYREPDALGSAQGDVQDPMLAPMPAHSSASPVQYLEEMQRSQSHSSAASDQPRGALERYYYVPPNEGKITQKAEQSLEDRPPFAPEAPSIEQRTLAGYEKLALELASSTSQVKPMYRKFEYLNHRLLLHLQDELAELEEQLRRADEIIAQMDPEGNCPPSSRRGEAYYGTDVHHHRVALLGRIFVKTEQYNKAMSSYSNMVRDCAPANSAAITSYQSWMARETPVHEIEARFLTKAEDLVMPGSTKHGATLQSTTTILCSTLILLPPALFTVAPTMLARLTIIVAEAMIIVVIRITTSALSALSLWDLVICVATFVLLTATMALLMPQHQS